MNLVYLFSPPTDQHHISLPLIADNDDYDSEIRDKFPSSFTDIPDARAVFEARKQREFMRATGAGVQPEIPLVSNDKTVVEDRHAQKSRLIREDDNDLSDDEGNGRDFRLFETFIKTVFINNNF